MNPMTKTLIFVGVAAVSVSLAVWRGLPTPEINPRDFANVGENFFPDFTDPNEATGIRVVIFNGDTAEMKSFEVKNQEGDWRIPSHYNYPADGQEQLVKTAGSLVAVKRGAVVGESEQDFERLGVVDPLLTDRSKVKGRGERLTLTKGNDVLLDLIIGNKAEERGNLYYVRNPEEKLTYIAELDIDLSTQFSDWIEQDLLQLQTASVRDILIKDYSVNEATRRIEFNDVVQLDRMADADPWTLEGLNEEAEELNTAEVNAMLQGLADLKIIGVRPKPQGLSANLKLSGAISLNELSLLDMQRKGFYVVPTPDGGAELFANEGDLAVVTEEGVAYVLRFGEVFLGNEFDIEVGSIETEPEAAAEEAAAENQTPENSADLKQSRYLFVSVQFDPDALGPEPVKPEPPAEKPAAEEKPAEPAAETVEAAAEPAGTTAEAAVNSEEKPEAAETPEQPEDLQKAYEAALKQYEADLADYQARLAAGEKRVAELNERFADWYYVIDAASFDQIHKGRADLVQNKTPAEPAEKTEIAPGLELTPNSETATPKMEAADAPAGDAKPEVKPEAETPAAAEEAGKKEMTTESAAETPATETPSAEKPGEGKPESPEKPAETPVTPASPATPETPPADPAPPADGTPASEGTPAAEETPANNPENAAN